MKVLENMRPADENLIYKYAILLGEKAFKPIKKDIEVKYLVLLFCSKVTPKCPKTLPYFYGVNIDLGNYCLFYFLFTITLTTFATSIPFGEVSWRIWRAKSHNDISVLFAFIGHSCRLIST